ncbi:NACHT, LRR and PYD domains-containing protein 1b allele 2-like [Symphorus nematophorus]
MSKSPSNGAMDEDITLSCRLRRACDRQPTEESGVYSMKSESFQPTDLNSIFTRLEEIIVAFVKEELKRFQRAVSTDHPECLETQKEDEEVANSEETKSKEAFLKITQHFLRNMDHEDLAVSLQKKIGICQHQLKSNLKQKCQLLGNAEERHPTSLNQIYTELCITEEGNGEVSYEHEVRQIEAASMKQAKPETTIRCEDIFKPSPGRDQPDRTVMTCGVSGIGKTVSTSKFVLDWAEDKANQDIEFTFPFTFQELNLLKGKKYSLVKLLHDFFNETKEAEIYRFDSFRVLFIFDGLDECQLPLDFRNNEIVTDVTESTSVDVLLTNLIRGKLLPSARLWITTRPAAANLIPRNFVDMVTEVRGFTDPQKEEYFRKRFRDPELASRIISHIKTSQGLHSMCRIPLFCKITATVFEDILTTNESQELPKTLTVFYIHFLLVQVKLIHVRNNDKGKTREMILSLGKLAFEQLKKGNLIFCEEDLRECGIDIRAASLYSGVFTQICAEKSRHKLFCFVHLTIQEFLAALYVFLCFNNLGINLLLDTPTTSWWSVKRRLKHAAKDFYQSAVNRALQCPHGHLDMFLRFLLGLSLETNHTLLKDLLKPMGSSSETIQKTVQYIKKKIQENPSTERSINLFHCLNEMNDHSLVEEIQQYLSSVSLPTDQFSPAQWSALVFILLSSVKELNVFDLKKYSASEEGLLRLLPVVKASSMSLLSGCNLTEKSCEALSSVLSSPSCNMRELDLSNNSLEDSGVQQLCAGLERINCGLKTLRLNGCKLTKRSCGVLASVLSSTSCHLRELDLSNNNLRDAGVELLCAGLKNPTCRLKTLRLSGCQVTKAGCAALASALRSNPSHLRELDLSYNHPGVSGVKLLSDGLENPDWKLETLSLQSGAGCFECSISALRWVCKEKVGFKYQFCSWDEHGQRPSCMEYIPAGPLMDITVTAGKLEEVHLPHWICVDDNSTISDMFAVLHVDTCGDFVEQASEVTASHVKLFQPVFSPRGAMIWKKLRFHVKVFYDVLIYKTTKTALTLHVYLVPPDPVLQQAVEKDETSDGSKKIRKPSPDKSLQMEGHFFLSTDSDTAEICPDKLKLTCERRKPNFFEMFIRNAKSDFTLKLEGEQKKGKDTVWTCTIRADDYQNRSVHREQGQHFVDLHRTALINRVCYTGAILDELKDRKLISNETYGAVRALKTTQDQMRDILKFVTAAGTSGKDALYEILKGREELSSLVSELEGSR